MLLMKLSDEIGPIHSTSYLDRPGQRESVIDYADRGLRKENMWLLLAHKVAPGIVEPSDMVAQQNAMGYEQRRQFEAAARSQQRPGALGTGLQGQLNTQRRGPQRTPAQQAAYWVGIIVWLVFILISLLMRLVK
jgi:hypothetical protein